MTITIVVFYGSLVAMIAMVCTKVYEVSKNKVVATTRIAQSIDHVFEAWFRNVRNFLRYISWHNAELFFWWCVRGIFRTLHISYKYVEQKAANDPRSRRIIDMVRGKHVPQRNGGASVYLKRIKPDRPQ